MAGSGLSLYPGSLSGRGALLHPGRMGGVESPVALFDASSPFVSGDRRADMVWASAFACRSDFLLRLAVCQRKHLIGEAGLGALASG